MSVADSLSLVLSPSQAEVVGGSEMERTPLRPAEGELVRCGHCERTRPAAAFHKSSRSRTGLQSWCGECVAAYRRTRDQRNKNAAAMRERRAELPRRAKSPQASFCLGQECGKCRACFTRRAWRQGSFRNLWRTRGDRWMPEDDDLLRRMAGCVGGADAIEAEFKRVGRPRSKMAIRNRASTLGLYLAWTAWSANRLCALFGTSYETLRRAWLESGLLKAQRLERGKGCRQGEWVIQEADIAAFIRTYPWAYDSTRMTLPNHQLTRLAHTIQGRDPWVVVPVAAAAIGVSDTAIRRWCYSGVISYHKRVVGIQGAGGMGGIVIRLADLPEAKAEIERRHSEARAFIKSNLQRVMRERRAGQVQRRAAA